MAEISSDVISDTINEDSEVFFMCSSVIIHVIPDTYMKICLDKDAFKGRRRSRKKMIF